MYAIYTYINGRKTFLGKHIKDEIVREFPFTKAVLWQNKNLGFDMRLLEYAKEHKIKRFVFSDPVKNFSLRIGIKAAINNGKEDEHGEGKQWYIPKSIMLAEVYKRTPYVKKERIL